MFCPSRLSSVTLRRFCFVRSVTTVPPTSNKVKINVKLILIFKVSYSIPCFSVCEEIRIIPLRISSQLLCQGICYLPADTCQYLILFNTTPSGTWSRCMVSSNQSLPRTSEWNIVGLQAKITDFGARKGPLFLPALFQQPAGGVFQCESCFPI